MDLSELGRAALTAKPDMRSKLQIIDRALDRLEGRHECEGCLGYLIVEKLARDKGILSVVGVQRPLEFFDPENGGIVDTVEFFNTRRGSK